MSTRLCATCDREKSIRGVWYLAPGHASEGTPFVCEACWRGVEAPLQAIPAL